jgi:hypothetical protein
MCLLERQKGKKCVNNTDLMIFINGLSGEINAAKMNFLAF